MISAELHAEIRRLFYAEHWKVGTIVAQLGVHHDTVETAIGKHRFGTPHNRHVSSLLDKYKPFIQQTLENYPRLRATRLHQMLQDRGYMGSVYPVRRYVQRTRPIANREAFFRLTVMPGEQAQVDWASFGTIRVGRALRKLSCFLLTLSWSRALWARFTFDQTLESFVRCHVLAFEWLGGVMRQELVDNLKAAVLERVDTDLIRFNPTILALAGHYHFAVIPCGKARGNEKGRVERRVRDLRDSFFAARSFTTVEDLNAQLAIWIERVQMERSVPGDPDQLKVRQALEEERKALLPLPAHRFVCDFTKPIRSGKTPYIRFDRNDYSIPHTHVQKPITLVASDTVVRLLDGADEIAHHERSYDAGRQLENPAHLEQLADHKRRARELRGRNRAIAACPAAKPFLENIALHGGHLGGTTSRLLRLLDQYGPGALNAALIEAHARAAFSAHSVAHILDQRRRADGELPIIQTMLPDDPRVRDTIVTPHALDDYDVLATERGHRGQ
jgi:transposase